MPSFDSCPWLIYAIVLSMNKRCTPLHPLSLVPTLTLRDCLRSPLVGHQIQTDSSYFIIIYKRIFYSFFITFEIATLLNPASWTKHCRKSYFEAPAHSFLHPMSSPMKNKGNLKMEGKFPEGRGVAERHWRWAPDAGPWGAGPQPLRGTVGSRKKHQVWDQKAWLSVPVLQNLRPWL